MLGRSVRVAREAGMRPALRSTAGRCVDNAGRRAKSRCKEGARCLGCLDGYSGAWDALVGPVVVAAGLGRRRPASCRPHPRRHPALTLLVALPLIVLLLAAAPPSSSSSSTLPPPPHLSSSFFSPPPRPRPYRHPPPPSRPPRRHHALILHLAPLPPSRLTSFPPQSRPSRRRHPALVLHLAAPALILLVAAAPPSSSTSALPLPSSSSLPPPQLWSSFSSSPTRPRPLPRHPLASCSPCCCGSGAGRAGYLGGGSSPSTPSSPPLHHASLR